MPLEPARVQSPPAVLVAELIAPDDRGELRVTRTSEDRPRPRRSRYRRRCAGDPFEPNGGCPRTRTWAPMRLPGRRVPPVRPTGHTSGQRRFTLCARRNDVLQLADAARSVARITQTEISTPPKLWPRSPRTRYACVRKYGDMMPQWSGRPGAMMPPRYKMPNARAQCMREGNGMGCRI